MRDLGLMGESVFTLWCADIGLIPNGSRIDKTGWDFIVEFPFETTDNSIEIHESAYECRVQVKATDKRDRKNSITLSNLRRLITARMPTFFVFIEFDGGDSAKRAFIVHIDKPLISRVLERLHKINQSEEVNKFNKRRMTIHYDETQKIDQLNGDFLKVVLKKYIGDNLSRYIENKISHLESTGYEDGFAQISFVTEGEENIKHLVDVSLGIKNEVELSTFQGSKVRFGIATNQLFADFEEGGKLKMPNIQPNARGTVSFKESKLSPGFVFDADIYVSPFNRMIPQKFHKIRVDGDFFDLNLSLFTGSSNYLFSLGGGMRLEIRKFRDALKLLNLLRTSGKNIFAELDFKGLPFIEFGVGCTNHKFDYSHELDTLEHAVKILSYFDVTDTVDISIAEISRNGTVICQMADIINGSSYFFRVEFSVNEGDDKFDISKNVAIINMITAPIGSHFFGLILVLTGKVKNISNEHYQYQLSTNKFSVERKLISAKDKKIKNEDLLFEIESVEKIYEDDYSVVTMFDKKC